MVTTVKWRLLHLAIVERQMAIFERQKLHSQRPPNYDNCEPTAVKWRLLQNLVTTGKCNDRETTSQKLNNRRLSCMKFCVASWLLSFQVPLGSLWPKVTEPKLRFPAVFCEHLRKSAVFCSFLRPPNAWISRRRGESAKICGFLWKSALWALSVTLVPSP